MAARPIKILLCYSDTELITSIAKLFNPPAYLASRLKRDVGGKYELHGTTRPLEALQWLARQNVAGIPVGTPYPFDLLVCEVKEEPKELSAPEIAALDLLEQVNRLGLLYSFKVEGEEKTVQRNNLGLIAITHQEMSAATLEQLMYLGVRQLLREPFGHQELEQSIERCLKILQPSNKLFFDPRKDGDGNLEKLMVRWCDLNDKIRGTNILPKSADYLDADLDFRQIARSLKSWLKEG